MYYYNIGSYILYRYIAIIWYIAILCSTLGKGRGRKAKPVLDGLYTCNIDPNKCKFDRKASKLHTATTGLSDHVELKYRIFMDRKPKDFSGPTGLTRWMNRAVEEAPELRPV